MIWLFALLSLPPAVVAGRDLRLNFRAPIEADPMKTWGHARARAGAVAFAVTAPWLTEVSVIMAAVFWALSTLFVFVLFPNRILTEPPAPKKTRKRR